MQRYVLFYTNFNFQKAYDSSSADDNTGGDASSQWSMSPSLPSDITSQHAFGPIITTYNVDNNDAISHVLNF